LQGIQNFVTSPCTLAPNIISIPNITPTRNVELVIALQQRSNNVPQWSQGA